MSAILILGDPHIGGSLSLGKVGIGSSLNSRVVDQIKILDWVLDQAQLHQVESIIITGDVFDDVRPQYNLIILFIEWLQRCEEHNIAVHIILGNHDLLRSGSIYSSSLDILSSCEFNKVFFHKKISTLHLNDMGITLMPFRDRRSFNTDSNTEALNILRDAVPYELAGIDLLAKKVIVGHLAIEGSIPLGFELGELSNELFCPVDMFKGYDYVFMGHIHKHQVLSQDNPYVAHTGSMDTSNFGETDQDKFITILDTDSKNFFRHIKIPTRPIKQIDINIPKNCMNVMQFIENSLIEENDLDEAIVRINITLFGSQSAIINRSIIEDILYKRGVFHIARIAEERKVSNIQTSVSSTIDNTINEFTAIEMFAKSIDEDIREDFIKAANATILEVQSK